MVKDIIFFTNIALYQQCELEARKLSLKKADDFIVKCLTDYFAEKNGKLKEFKKPMDLWIALDEERKVKGLEIAQLMERICDNALKSRQSDRKEGILHKINDVMSLPRG